MFLRMVSMERLEIWKRNAKQPVIRCARSVSDLLLIFSVTLSCGAGSRKPKLKGCPLISAITSCHIHGMDAIN